MENPSPEALRKLLQDLAAAPFAGTRRWAASSLGEQTTSSVEIVQALAAAVATDSDPEVRSAAVLALQAPAHQEFIQNHPDLMKQAVESAVRSTQHKQEEADEKIILEFRRRLSREKKAYLVFILGIIAFFVLFILLVTENWDRATTDWILRFFQVVVFASAGIFIWRSWRKFRCPACDGWLGGFKAGINVWFASAPLKCPHCGTRLM